MTDSLRKSATILANAGATMDGIKRHGGWRSTTVAEGYVDESETTKKNVACLILRKADGSVSNYDNVNNQPSTS
ncbi:hypothetical protein NQ315_017542, partial [Exocentrus adspersus]